MITVQINHDSDEITMSSSEFRSKIEFNTKHTVEIQEFLVELFNFMNISDVVIYKQSEGEISSVSEW